jgi:hypothetical protein
MVPFSVLLQNRSVFAEVCWAAERSEMASTAVSSLPLNSVDDDFPGNDGLSDDSFSSNDSDQTRAGSFVPMKGVTAASWRRSIDIVGIGCAFRKRKKEKATSATAADVQLTAIEDHRGKDDDHDDKKPSSAVSLLAPQTVASVGMYVEAWTSMRLSLSRRSCCQRSAISFSESSIRSKSRPTSLPLCGSRRIHHRLWSLRRLLLPKNVVYPHQLSPTRILNILATSSTATCTCLSPPRIISSRYFLL